MTHRIALALVAAGLLGGAASAQTAPAPFNGPFIGAEAGWQQDRFKANATTGGVTVSDSVRGEGLGYRGFLGYDFNLNGSAVAGLEVGVGGVTGSITDAAIPGASLKPGRTIDVTGRVGALVTPESLLYVRGGYANGRFSLRDATGSESTNRDGWVLGVGFEQQLAPNVSGRLEYNYTRFNRYEDPASDLGVDSVNARFTRNAVKAGVAFRF